MKLLRTLAVASASAALIMGQAVAAFACEEHETAALTARLARLPRNTTVSPSPRRRAIRSWPIPPGSPASPTAYGCHGSALRKGRSCEEPGDRCDVSRSPCLCA